MSETDERISKIKKKSKRRGFFFAILGLALGVGVFILLEYTYGTYHFMDTWFEIFIGFCVSLFPPGIAGIVFHLKEKSRPDNVVGLRSYILGYLIGLSIVLIGSGIFFLIVLISLIGFS